MTIKSAMLATTALALACATSQASERPMYVDVGGGANWIHDQAARTTRNTTFAEWFGMQSSGDTGFVLTAANGAHLDSLVHGFRVELEASYRRNSADGVWGSSTPRMSMPSVGNLEFDESTWAVLANAWYDVDLGSFRPYIGGGAGWAETKLEGRYFGRNPRRLIDFSGDGFAWQLGAGINFEISENTTIGIGYRYFSSPDVEILPPNLSNRAIDGSVNDIRSQSVVIDLSFSL